MANVTDHVVINGSVGTSQSSQFVGCNEIILLKNDHASQDLIVNWGADTASAGAITLKFGEKIENLKADVGTLYYKGSGATTTFRFIGKRGFNA